MDRAGKGIKEALLTAATETIESGAALLTAVTETIESGAVRSTPQAGTEEQEVRNRLLDRRRGILRRQAVGRRSLALADSLAIFAAVGLIGVLGGPEPRLPVLLIAPLFILIAKVSVLYDRDANVLHKTTLDEAPRLFGLATVTTLLLWLGEGVVVTSPFSKVQVVGLWALLPSLHVSFRALARAGAAAAVPPERCLVIGDRGHAELLRQQFEIAHSTRAEIVGCLPLPAENGRSEVQLPPALGRLLLDKAVDRVILARPPAALEGAEEFLNTLRQLGAYGVKISLLPRAARVAGTAVEVDHLPGLTLLGIRGIGMTRSSRLVKRCFVLAGASLAAIVLSPLLALIAIAIKVDSRGPVLFRQRRVGRNGRKFMMLKFRSMVHEADQLKEELRALNEGGPGLFKIAADPRITRVGRVLRRLSLDELPQLWNVLRGEMSLVGPRPLIPEEDENIYGWHRRRLEVRPGITGHWQILCSARRITLPEMAKLDYLYVANWSLWSDIRLLLRTLPFVVRGHGV